MLVTNLTKVELLDSMGNDNTIANTARVSFADFSNWNELPKGYTETKRDNLLRYLADHEHTAPFRHAQITVRCSAPIAIARQLMKHQIGMVWSEESRRYISTEPAMFVPREFRSKPVNGAKQGSGKALTWYMALAPVVALLQSQIHAVNTYNGLISYGICPEQARLVLPVAQEVTWIWTGSLAAFAHMYLLRTGAGAQVEATEFAELLHPILLERFPKSWEVLTEI